MVMGYTCLTCGVWVNSGDLHYCAFAGKPETAVSTSYDLLILSELQKITALLEQLVKEKA